MTHGLSLTRGLGLAWMCACLLIVGCPPAADTDNTDDDDNLPPPANLVADASGPAESEGGAAVQLTASATGDFDASEARYEWFQTYGRAVTLSDANAASPTFTAPKLASGAVLKFRVDVTVRGKTVASDEITVMVAPSDELPDDGGDGGDDDDPFPRVELVTSMGRIVVELNRDRAPISTANFLRYVDDEFYDGTIFHRVISDFVVQGGGFEPDLTQKDTNSPIRNESTNGLLNERGTIAMARTAARDSATSQFYFNLKHNTDLDFRDDASPGYAVFGRIVEGLAVMDEIAEVETATENGFDDVPTEDVILERARRVEAE